MVNPPSRVMSAPEELQTHGHESQKAAIANIGRATIELSKPAQVAIITLFQELELEG